MLKTQQRVVVDLTLRSKTFTYVLHNTLQESWNYSLILKNKTTDHIYGTILDPVNILKADTVKYIHFIFEFPLIEPYCKTYHNFFLLQFKLKSIGVRHMFVQFDFEFVLDIGFLEHLRYTVIVDDHPSCVL